MLKRRKIRELAMQILFLWDTHQERNEDLARAKVAAANNQRLEAAE